MATVTKRAIVWSTTAGNKTTAAFVPAVNDLLVVASLHSAQDGASTITDSLSGTYTNVGTLPSYSTAQAGTIGFYLRDTGVSGASMTVTSAPAGTSTGGGLAVLSVAGSSGYGSGAYVKEAVQADQAAGTPAPVFGSAPASTNCLIGVVCTNTNGSANCTEPAGWAVEDYDQGYNTPASGIHVCHIDSGFTSTTVTYGAATPSQFGAHVIEILASTATETAVAMLLE